MYASRHAVPRSQTAPLSLDEIGEGYVEGGTTGGREGGPGRRPSATWWRLRGTPVPPPLLCGGSRSFARLWSGECRTTCGAAAHGGGMCAPTLGLPPASRWATRTGIWRFLFARTLAPARRTARPTPIVHGPVRTTAAVALRDPPSLTTEDYCLSSQSQTSFWPHWPALAADCARPAPHRSPSPCAPHAAPPLCDEIGLRAERHSDGGRCQPPELHLGSSAMRDSCAFSRGRRCGCLHMSFWKAPVFPAASSQWADLVGAAHPTSVSHAAVSHTFARRMQVRRDGRRGAATFCVSATCAEHRGSGDPRGRTGGRT